MTSEQPTQIIPRADHSSTGHMWPWVTAALGAVAAFGWGFTYSPAALCSSVLGEVAQGLDAQTAHSCTAATALHTAGGAFTLLFLSATAVIAWRFMWLHITDPAIRSLIAVSCALCFSIAAGVGGSLTASFVQSSEAAAAARSAAAAAAAAQAQAQRQANAQASAQAAQQQAQQLQQDQSTLISDVGQLTSDATAQENDKTLAEDIQTMQADWGTEQNDAASCSAANPNPGAVSADDASVQADYASLQSDVQSLQSSGIPTIQQDMTAVENDIAAIQADGGTPVPGSGASSALALGKKTITDSNNAITWALGQGQQIQSQADNLAASLSNNSNC